MGSRIYRVDTGKGIVQEQGSWTFSGRSYPITHVLGGGRVLFFFTSGERGRLVALPVAYDVRAKTWIDREQSGVVHARTDLSDRDVPLVFSSSCFGCHVNPLAAHYDIKTDSYRMELSGPGLSCEACHGSVARHEAVMRYAPRGTVPEDIGIARAGAFSAGQHSETCAPCHAASTPLTTTYRPGEPFFDHYDLAVLDGKGFSPDGRVLGEHHTYTTWLMNPCARSGKLGCLHCHAPGGGYRFAEPAQANNACMPCHAKIVGDPGRHTRHGPRSPGSVCISCHMPGIGPGPVRFTDHSMRPPSPAASMLYRSPDACISCHGDKDHAWADQWARTWFGRDFQDPVMKRARLVDQARRKDWSDIGEMLVYIQARQRDEVYAASLVRLLAACPEPAKVPVLRAALRDPSPLLRSSAAAALGQDLTPAVVQDLVRAAADPVRVVRVRAAAALSRRSGVALPDEEARALGRATGEYIGSLMVRQDHWSSHAGMGTYFLGQGDARNALMAFKAASRLEPSAVPPYVGASIAHARLGDVKAAETELDNALRIEPENAQALFNMGMLKKDQHNTREAAAYLVKAFRSDPAMAEAAHNLSIVLSAENMREAIGWARKAYGLQPDIRHGYTLAQFLKQDGDWNEGIGILRRLIERYPLHADSYLLLGELYEKRGRNNDAAQVYRQGISVRDMPETDRARMEKRLHRIR